LISQALIEPPDVAAPALPDGCCRFCRAGEPPPLAAGEQWPTALARRFLALHEGLSLQLERDPHSGYVAVSRLMVPARRRRQGLGSQIISGICWHADQAGDVLVGTPDPIRTAHPAMSARQLERWYMRDFGFRRNRGMRRDFTTQHALLRPPQVRDEQEVPMDRTPDEVVAAIDSLIAGAAADAPEVSDDAMRAAPAGTPGLNAEPEPTTAFDLFGPYIDIYTRADAIADGSQHEVPADITRAFAIRVPMSVTSAVWHDCVAWTDADSERTGVILQDETDRLTDLVKAGWLTACRTAPTGDFDLPFGIPFTLDRFNRKTVFGPDDDQTPTTVNLVIVLGADFDGTPIITIMTPREHSEA
jgi:GNAT superfamily N-acetyltransferase